MCVIFHRLYKCIEGTNKVFLFLLILFFSNDFSFNILNFFFTLKAYLCKNNRRGMTKVLIDLQNVYRSTRWLRVCIYIYVTKYISLYMEVER